MIVRSIHLREGIYKRDIDFTNGVNLIHSARNSRGKTTLVRFILYGLGYNIPGTRKIQFKRCHVKLEIFCEHLGEVCLERNDSQIIEMTTSSEKQLFVLPNQSGELHSRIFGSDNIDILNNLLGCFYVDQEKGWTLLNRGVVIGSIHFNIEDLIRGLSGTDCSKMIADRLKTKRELEKYKEMHSVALYREQLQIEEGDLAGESYENEINSKIDQLNIQMHQVKKEIRRIDQTLADNKRFKEFIEELRLFVKAPDGSTFSVTKENLVGFDDATSLLVTKRRMLYSQQVHLSEEIKRLQQRKEEESEQLSFIKKISPIEMFDKRVSQMPINAIVTKREIDRLEKELHALNERITLTVKRNNQVAPSMAKTVIRYCTELGVNTDETPISENYIFTSNLKELSGAILHKMVFAFRLAYIQEVEKNLAVKLPIILDSPSGKEVDAYNVDTMMQILQRDFSDHQIIIASIFHYNFLEVNLIEIGDRLIDDHI